MRLPQVSERIKEAPAQALRGMFAGIGQLLLITDKLRNKPPFGQQAPSPHRPEPTRTAAAPRAESAQTVTDSAAATAPAEQDATPEPAADQAPRAPKVPRTPRTPRSTSAPRTPKIPAGPQNPKTPAAAAETRDLDKTGNVRLISGDDARTSDEPTSAEERGPAPAAAAEEPGSASVAATEEPRPAPLAEAAEPARADPGEPSGGPAEAGPPLPNYGELSIASLRARLRNLDVAQVRGLLEYEQAHAARADVIVMFEHRIAKLEAGG